MSEANFTTPPPQASAAASGAPTMFTPETLANIYFEPGATFEALRERPRFLVAALITVVLFVGFYLLLTQKLGPENIVQAQVEAQSANMDPAQQEQMKETMSKPIVRVITMASFPVVFAVMFAGGAALYLLGTMLMGKAMSYKQALAVWVYSSFAPFVLLTIANVVLLLINPPEGSAEIARVANRINLVHANPSAFIDSAAHPVLATALGALDPFAFFGLFLAALGLRKVARLPSGSAWGVVLAVYAVAVVGRVAMSAVTGRPS